jgi:predicted MPP superfamily phosphohydrolase
MRFHFLHFFSIIIVLFGAMTYYIALRSWQAFARWLPAGSWRVYSLVFLLLALSYFFGRLGETYFHGWWSAFAYYLGSYWLGVVFYCLFILPFIDLLRLINYWWPFLPNNPLLPAVTGIAVVVLLFGLLGYGTWNAWHPVVRHYAIDIPKQAGTLTHLHVVMVSDTHLGIIVSRRRLVGLIRRIDELHPDLVLLPGDIIDDNPRPVEEAHMPELFHTLTPRFGMYAALGNHEYMGGKSQTDIRLLASGGITELKDSYRLIDNAFYVVGRDDLSGARFNNQPRQELDEVMAGIDHSLPIILLDHQPWPKSMEDAKEQGVDLQLSGHTHAGQFFPLNLLTKRLFELNWGYLRKGATQYIVSCGYGTWGPPIRIGNTPELVDIDIHFK